MMEAVHHAVAIIKGAGFKVILIGRKNQKVKTKGVQPALQMKLFELAIFVIVPH